MSSTGRAQMDIRSPTGRLEGSTGVSLVAPVGPASRQQSARTGREHDAGRVGIGRHRRAVAPVGTLLPDPGGMGAGARQAVPARAVGWGARQWLAEAGAPRGAHPRPRPPDRMVMRPPDPVRVLGRRDRIVTDSRRSGPGKPRYDLRRARRCRRLACCGGGMYTGKSARVRRSPSGSATSIRAC